MEEDVLMMKCKEVGEKAKSEEVRGSLKGAVTREKAAAALCHSRLALHKRLAGSESG